MRGAEKSSDYDLVVLGGTPAGVMAAYSAGKAGNKVVVLEPNSFIGGEMAGGLTKTDIGRRETVGGLSLDFFRRVKDYYTRTYGADSLQVKQSHEGLFFEPHVAELIFRQMLKEANVEVRTKQQLVDATVTKDHLTSIKIRNGPDGAVRDVSGRVFIDATYEGDLMAAAHVPYRVGREARSEYGESLAGITAGPPETIGMGDHRVEAYNIRSPITNDPKILAPVPKPKHYTPEKLQSFIDVIQIRKYKSFEELFFDWPNWGEINGKFDSNRGDLVGVNYNYPEGTYETRAAILAEVQDYFLSLWWMLQNDPRLSEEFRASAKKWGLPKDEFLESGHISPQIYVREARRMIGRYLMTQRDLETNRHKDDTICLGSYNIDSHAVQQILYKGKLITEEGYFTSSVEPYEIPYRSLTPYDPDNLLVACAMSATHVAYGSIRMEPVYMMLGQATGTAAALALKHNTPVQAVPVKELQDQLHAAGIPLVAAYHPAVAIAKPPLAVPVNQPVTFHSQLIEGAEPMKYFWNFDGTGAVQSTDPNPTYTFTVSKPAEVSLKAIDAKGFSSMVAFATVQVGDDATPDLEATAKEAKMEGLWDRYGAYSPQNRHRSNYHDMNAGKGHKSVTFTTTIPRNGTYTVAFAFQGGVIDNKPRSTNTPVTIFHEGQEARVTVNQATGAQPFVFQPLGDFHFKAGEEAKVVVSNEGTDGDVSVDAVRWIWRGP